MSEQTTTTIKTLKLQYAELDTGSGVRHWVNPGNILSALGHANEELLKQCELRAKIVPGEDVIICSADDTGRFVYVVRWGYAL
jgi:hypothetical protein